ncbi:MAG TPA: HD domain-containing protein [Pyrinomonadaceae bacterium]|jgi:putative hydrolase of HD superfamily|nr:HD domain-containing protein [Pyrinomonadaceae bacterium]
MISTLIELQRLKRLERTGWTLRGLAPGAESVAAHSFGVALAAMMLADEVRTRGESVDVERLLRMALLHDWAEARVGDMPRTGGEYFGAEARRRAERAAFDDIVGGLGRRVETAYSELHEDYEHRASLEARLVKAADIIDLLVQALAFERAGVRGLDEFWDGVAERDFLLEGTAREVFNDALRLLFEARAELK